MEKPIPERRVWWVQYLIGLKPEELGPFYSEQDVRDTIPKLKVQKKAHAVTYYAYWERRIDGVWVGVGHMRVFNEKGDVVWPPGEAV